MDYGIIFWRQGYLKITFNAHEIEFKVPICLTEIKNIKEWDINGYIVIETNYGEEYVDLQHLVDKLDLNINLEQELSKIKGYKLGGKYMYNDKDLQDIYEKSDMIVKNIAFKCTQDENNGNILEVKDINNKDNKAVFRVKDGDFILSLNSFPTDNGKYEMLYILERNKELLLEEFRNA